ncbi:MAG: LysR family transcriptional regulator [Rhizorhabdus sp.]
MIDPSEIRSFVTVAEERSFSAAAALLGLTQSAVSQKVKRLEDQLSLHLLDRTSRRVRLSQEGEKFMPHALRLLEIHAETLRAADVIRSQRGSTLLLGGYSFLIEERLKLVEHFLELNPAIQVEVHHGDRQALFHRLAHGDLDAVIGLSLPGNHEPEFDAMHVERRGCHIALPPGHALISRDELTFADLVGLALVISPGRQDAAILNVVQRALIARGICLVPAPEADRRAIEQFAHVRELPYLRWYASKRARHEHGGFTVVPVTDNDLFTDLVVYFQRGGHRPIVDKFSQALEHYGVIHAERVETVPSQTTRR